MAMCECGDLVVVCGDDCGCGCVCDTGTDRCWSLCDCPSGPIIEGPEDAVVIAPSGSGSALDISTEVKLCANGIRLATLARVLSKYVNADIYVPAARFEDKLETRASGRLTDVLSECGCIVEPKY